MLAIRLPISVIRAASGRLSLALCESFVDLLENACAPGPASSAPSPLPSPSASLG